VCAAAGRERLRTLCELCGGAPTILLFTICCLRPQSLAETVIAKNDLVLWKAKNKISTILRTVSVAAALEFILFSYAIFGAVSCNKKKYHAGR